jgi:hypothetical protein
MVFLPFSFLNKQANTYAIMYKDSNQTNCKYAFLLIPAMDIIKAMNWQRVSATTISFARLRTYASITEMFLHLSSPIRNRDQFIGMTKGLATG